MSIVEALAFAVVLLSGLYFLALGSASLLRPAQASRYLLGFATSAGAHFAELAVRFLVGAALVIESPRMLFSAAFHLFGWLLLVTTAALLLVPWRWHRRFAQQAVPRALRFIPLIGVTSLLLGILILAARLRGKSG